ncbi:MAG: prepilin-type N-terminal cleavage/methylation domain-containing protein [Verrucomicrobia bacterium]|nr:prepilin-type N-terminal cleavage/methylation domain-containing protein [Verrucomicrobiota bacterium]
MRLNPYNAFTLIEFLVVIAIIAVPMILKATHQILNTEN